MVTLKELTNKEDLFVAGHRLCPGCVIPSILRIVLRATKYPVVVSNATGCLSIASSKFPQTSWKINWIHSAFGNAAATISGIEAVYRSFKRRGKFSEDKEIKFLAIGGDGATYDTGLGSLSGALERGHNFVYLCYDNQLNAATGGQRTSASPIGASTTTTPAGKVLLGKLQFRKNISNIIAAHKIPYVAQSAPWRWQDLYNKSKAAFEIEGPSYLNVLSSCPTKWMIPSDKSIEITKLASDTCVWPLYEIKDGTKITVNYKPKKKLPVTEWIKTQIRFKHLLRTENKWIIDKIQEEVDNEWELLLFLENKTKGN